jgi:hypothetical protein
MQNSGENFNKIHADFSNSSDSTYCEDEEEQEQKEDSEDYYSLNEDNFGHPMKSKQTQITFFSKIKRKFQYSKCETILIFIKRKKKLKS